MIVTLSIFIMIILIVINVYLVISTTQRRTVQIQKLQSDTRYVFEAMAQEIRLGKINYDFYANDTAPIDLHPDATAGNYDLALINQAQEKIFFRRGPGATLGAGTTLQYCKEIETGDCELTAGAGWHNITPEGVQVLDLRFQITPSADPFSMVEEQTCTEDADCTRVYSSYRCDDVTDNRCEYFTDGEKFQPKVKIILQVQGTDTSIPVQSRTLSMQTIVSSRILQGSVQNENY